MSGGTERPVSAADGARAVPARRAGGAAPDGPLAAPRPESEVVERVRGGDVAAFGELVRTHARKAYAIAYRVLGHREDSEDLVQDAFLAALEKIGTFQAGRAFGPWLYRIVVNRALNARKSRAVRATEPIPDGVVSPVPSPERAAELAEVRDRLRGAMATLPERQRVAVQLFELEGFSGAEVAEILELPEGTVRWHLHRARRTLRAALEPGTMEER
ncbi:MAG TPA: sigma-70 family RNA polymerase sigma factor [Longimicrobiales bacterium]|nr:sigma-70 family RNA polymerase sigma factor [Longimicrobiales bacterium]